MESGNRYKNVWRNDSPCRNKRRGNTVGTGVCRGQCQSEALVWEAGISDCRGASKCHSFEEWHAFEQLFNDIDDINIYKYQKHQFSSNFKKTQKEKYRKSNTSNYNVLYNEKEKLITWYSDETAFCVANVLKIKKEDEIFKLEFFIQPYIDGYDRDFNSLHHIPIRFRNSGSFYNPFNVVFMRMYSNMKEIDDVNDYGHQIHMEEYLYSQSKIKKLTK